MEEEEFNIDLDEDEVIEPEPMELNEEIDYIIDTYYKDELKSVVMKKRDNVRINFQLLSASARKLLNTNYTEYANNEDSITYIPTKNVNAMAREMSEPDDFKKIMLHFTDVTPELKIRQLNADRINGLMQINGIIISVSEPRSIMDVAMYRCKCGAPRAFKQYTSGLSKPSECFVCGAKRANWVLLETECKWDDYQEIVIQEND